MCISNVIAWVIAEISGFEIQCNYPDMLFCYCFSFLACHYTVTDIIIASLAYVHQQFFLHFVYYYIFSSEHTVFFGSVSVGCWWMDGWFCSFVKTVVRKESEDYSWTHIYQQDIKVCFLNVLSRHGYLLKPFFFRKAEQIKSRNSVNLSL